MSRLSISDVQASYGGPPVLHGIDLEVPAGAIAAILGPSGCGKTTLLRVIAGFEHARAGTVVLGDRVITSAGAASGPSTFVPPEKRRIGIVPQEGALFPHLSVWGNVAFGLPRSGRSRRHRAAEVAELLDLVGLADLGGRMPDELSGGQQQRVALARALAAAPELILLDEPFNALDAGLRASVRADVRAALCAANATAILVTHDQEEALSSADLVAVMRAGRIVQVGTPAEIYRAPQTLSVATFVGAATVLPAVADGAYAKTELGPLPLATHAYGAGHVVIRPEQLSIDAAEDPDEAGATDCWPARIVEVEFYGHDAKVSVEVNGNSGVLLTCRVLNLAELDGYDREVSVRLVGPVRFFADAAG